MNAPTYPSHARESSLIQEALDTLRNKTGVEGKVLTLESSVQDRSEVDAFIEFHFHDVTFRCIANCKQIVDRKAHIDHVRRRLEPHPLPGLLIAPYLTRELAEHCRATGLQFIDTHGNAYLRAPNFLVYIAGERQDDKDRSIRAPKGLTTAAGLRVVFALLSNPALLTAPFKDIVSASGVSLGAAYNALGDLERRGYLINRSSADRRQLLEWRALIDEWAINYPTTLRSKLKEKRFSAPDPDWWNLAHLEGFDAAWGGEVGAARLTGYLKPATQTIYVHPGERENLVRKLVGQHRLRPDPSGPIAILDKFWNLPPPLSPDAAPDAAPPLLVYSELLALLDPRAQETAAMVRERYIDPPFHQA